MWDYVKQRMRLYPKSQVSCDRKRVSFAGLLRWTAAAARSLPLASKCAVLCRREFNAARGLMLCFEAGVTAIPMPVKYGGAACEKIWRATGFDLVIVDEPELLELLPGYTGGVFLLDAGLIQAAVFTDTDRELRQAALIMSTSGTTGAPKCAVITSGGLLANLLDVQRYFLPGGADRICICRPLYHCAVLTGELLFSLANGLDIRFHEGGFEPRGLLRELEEQEITVLCATPTLLHCLCRAALRKNKRPPLRHIAVSGECMTQTTAALIRQALPGAAVYHVYGLTEAGPRVSYLPPSLFKEHPLSVGRPLDSVELRVVRPGEETPCAEGEEGDIQVRGPSVMRRYYRDEAATRRALSGGWLRTGDVGRLEGGLLYLRGRRDGMIIRAGVNIYPQEIEGLMLEQEEVEDVLAMGTDRQTGGQGIRLLVQPARPETGQAELLAICRKCLPPHLMPDVIEVVDTIPRNQSGKKIRKGEGHAGKGV